jgi:hypothetical protein
MKQRSERRALAAAAARDQDANPLRRVNLVAADADEVNAGMPQRLDLPAVALGGIDVKIRRTVEQIRNSGDGLSHAGLIVDVHDADEQRIRLDRFPNGFRIDPPRGFWIDACDAKAAALESFDGAQNRMMLDGRHNQVHLPCRTAVRFESKDGEIVTFRGPAREDHLAARGVHGHGDLVAGLLDSGAGAPSIVMRAAAGVSEAGFQMMQQDVADTRIKRCCGRAVEINGSHQNAIISQECGC